MSKELSISPRLQEILNRRVGETDVQSREAAFERITNSCPPIDPHLIRHLEKMFTNGKIKPTHPDLAQLLTVQYGVNTVIDYLKAHYDQQSAVARKANAI
jgi:hypothetical protein